MNFRVPATVLVMACAAACECRPVPPSDWRPFNVACNGTSSLAAAGPEQVILDSRESLDAFLRRDCLRGVADIRVPDVDFTREVVVMDVRRSPLEDGTCVKDRRVASVDACDGAVQLSFDDAPDPDCAARVVTGGAVVLRRHVRASLGTR